MTPSKQSGPARVMASNRAHRRRASNVARRPVLHVVAPGVEIAQAVPRKGETITAFLRRTGWATRDPCYGWQFRKRLPTILEVNGEAILRKDWRRTKITANDNVRFVSMPRGGGRQGKQVLGLVALIAVAAFAGPLGGMAASALGFGGSAVASGLATAAITFGGSVLINSLARDQGNVVDHHDRPKQSSPCSNGRERLRAGRCDRDDRAEDIRLAAPVGRDGHSRPGVGAAHSRGNGIQRRRVFR
jgi:hypothetical protein